MSTRYVWGRYDLGQSEQVISATSTETELPPCLSCDKVDHVSTSGQNFNLYLKTRGYQSGEIIVYANTEYTFDAAKKKYVIPTTGNYQSIRRPLNSGSDAAIWSPTSIAVAPESGEEPVAIYITIGERESSQMYMIKLNGLQMSRDVYWHCYFNGGNFVQVAFTSTPPDLPYADYLDPKGFSYFSVGKGSLVSDVSGTSQSSYPSDGVQGSYWYTYQGSDNIDPTAVTYPSGPKSGVPITITVTPRANTYGGTISYQYEYTLDGGNVWNQLALTTATSRQYTIPKGTQTFRVRVQARDNMGFTSSDWIYGPQVNVVNNSAPSAPPTITVPVSPRGGAQTTITWTASSDVDGNLAGYELERQLDGGSWTSLYTGAGLSYLDTIPKGTATAAYRVRAYDADGDYSGYTTSATRTVVNNNPPVITSSLSGDLGTKSAGFTVPYTVTDEEGGAVTVVEQVGNLVKRTHTPTLGQEQTFHVEDQDGDYFFTQILNGSQTVRITATDEGGLSSTLELPFTKAVHSMSVTLETPLEVEEAITVAIMSVLCSIPANASYQLLATNNAKDAEPVWQDVTADVAAGRNIIFTNQVQANGPAFNFKLSASRSEGGQGGYVKSLKGAFQ